MAIPLLPYERQSGESEEAFHAFRIYRDLGHKRTLDEVERRLRAERASADGGGALMRIEAPAGTRKAPKKHRKSGNIGAWSSRHEWVRRAAEWDRFIDTRIRAKQLDEIEKMALRHAQQSQLLTDLLMRPALALAEAMKDPEKMSRIARINDPMASMAELIRSPGITDLLELTNEAAKRLPRLQEAERYARGVRVLDEKHGPTQGGTAIWNVQIYQPPREGGELDLSRLEAGAPPEWDGDTILDGDPDD